MKTIESFIIEQVDVSLCILTNGPARIGGPIDNFDRKLRDRIFSCADELSALLQVVRERVPVDNR